MNNVEKIKVLRAKSGCGLRESVEALKLFDDNINRAYEYLRIYSQAVVRKRPDGTRWEKQDYIDWVNKYIE